MCMSRLRHNFSIVLALLAICVIVRGESEAKPETNAPVKTTITSERMTVKNKERQAVFEGEVVLTRGSLVVRSDVMVVFYRPDQHATPAPAPRGPGGVEQAQDSNLAVSRIEAMGRVQIEKEDGRATCRKAVYYQDQQKIILTGDPVAWQRGSRVTGQEIIMLLDQDRTIVEGGSKVILEDLAAGGP
jgi:lipopolysaccharide export system protein LptA